FRCDWRAPAPAERSRQSSKQRRRRGRARSKGFGRASRRGFHVDGHGIEIDLTSGGIPVFLGHLKALKRPGVVETESEVILPWRQVSGERDRVRIHDVLADE